MRLSRLSAMTMPPPIGSEPPDRRRAAAARHERHALAWQSRTVSTTSSASPPARPRAAARGTRSARRSRRRPARRTRSAAARRGRWRPARGRCRSRSHPGQESPPSRYGCNRARPTAPRASRRGRPPRRARPSLVLVAAPGRDDLAQQAVRLVVDAGREQRAFGRAGDAVAEPQRPQPVDLRSGCRPRRCSWPSRCAGARVVGVDRRRRRSCRPAGRRRSGRTRAARHQAPRRVQGAARRPAAAAGARRCRTRRRSRGPRPATSSSRVGVLLGVGHVQPAVELLDVERRVAGGQVGSVNAPAMCDRREAARRTRRSWPPWKSAAYRHGAVRRLGDRQSLVDGARRGDLGLRRRSPAPARSGSSAVICPASESKMNRAGAACTAGVHARSRWSG